MLSTLKSYQSLQKQYETVKNLHLRDLFTQDPQRFERFSLEAAGLFLDYSKHRITPQVLEQLVAFAHERNLKAEIQAMFEGEKINQTEKRAVLHTALRNRGTRQVRVDGQDVMPEVRAVLEQMKTFTEALHNEEWLGFTGKPITDVVNIGIGGSDLGPRMVVEALKPYHKTIRVHFVSNVDASHMLQTLHGCQPDTTLFLIASKSFTTQETMMNAHTARRWFLRAAGKEEAIRKHFVAISTNEAAVKAFGIAPENMFRFWDWVGGRFSLWSAIGLSVCCAIGFDRFEELLEGGYQMDEHFRTAECDQNMPVLMALLGFWYANFFKAATQAVLPYDELMHLFPTYLQQTDMESNGKSVTRSGEPVNYPTGPIVWGQAGTNGQHAFYQLIHQGTQLIPCDFIAPIKPHHDETEHHQVLLSHFLAQTEALMKGKTFEEAEKETPELAAFRTFRGNSPTSTLLLPQVTPKTLGSLIACYEHKIFTQGILWDVFSFDQWGVELGKQLAGVILPELQGKPEPEKHDSSTNGLIARISQYGK